MLFQKFQCIPKKSKHFMDRIFSLPASPNSKTTNLNSSVHQNNSEVLLIKIYKTVNSLLMAEELLSKMCHITFLAVIGLFYLKKGLVHIALMLTGLKGKKIMAESAKSPNHQIFSFKNFISNLGFF